MNTSSAKSKGRTFQQDIRDAILEAFPILERDDVKSTGMGQQGEDIQLSPQARKIFPYTIEAKRQEKLSIPQWWRQTVANIKDTTNPVLIFRQSRQKALVVITMEHFICLAKENHELKTQLKSGINSTSIIEM